MKKDKFPCPVLTLELQGLIVLHGAGHEGMQQKKYLQSVLDAVVYKLIRLHRSMLSLIIKLIQLYQPK